MLWTLHTVFKHQSYKSNDDIGEKFQTMFPDFDIVKILNPASNSMALFFHHILLIIFFAIMYMK